MKKVKLSIVVLSYNTKDLLKNCLKSLEKVRNEVEFEVIVPDNGSTDGSPEMVEKEFPWVKKVIKIGKNLGFAAGNNKARYFINGVYVLFLNPDAQVHTNTLFKTIKYLDSHADVGALGCKIVLPNGQLDQVGWFDEDYFLNAEDIDLCWKIKEKGWKIIYYPEVSITHIKGAAKGKTKETKKKVNLKEKLKYRLAEVDAMELFVKKRLWKKYPLALNLFVLTGTKLLRLIRA